ncbi:histidine kinase [Streptosporangium sp. NPDC000396]|uniref:sensor histidine kinase n=1 Tax=Streptosporangium sp. NPDC000396 TaxID=3366185 RepID=UPI00369D693C
MSSVPGRARIPATPRTANIFVLANLAVLEMLTLGNLIVPRPHVDKWAAPYLLWVAAMCAGPVVQVFVSLPRLAWIRERYGRRLFLLDLLIAYAPVLSPLRLHACAGFPMATTLIVFSGRTRWLLMSLQVTAAAAVELCFWPANSLGKPHDYVLYWLVDAGSVCLEVYGVTRFAQVMTALHGTRREVGLTSLAAERLRAGRDVHDLLGFSLTAITLKLEVARRALRGKRRATEELAEAATLTGRALAEARTVGAGEPLTSLAAETTSARTVLAWAGIDVHVTAAALPCGSDVDTTLALVLREAVTNTLRHSAATQCSITVTASGGAARLRVVNDGAGRRPAEGGAGGSGLRGLHGRVAAAGGEISTSREGDRFTLTATVPLVRARRLQLSWATSWATVILVLLHTMWFLDPFYWMRTPPGTAAHEVISTIVELALLIHLSRPRPEGRRPRLRWPAFGALVLVGGVMPYVEFWGGIASSSMIAAATLTVVRGRVAWLFFGAALFISLPFGSHAAPDSPVDVALIATEIIVVGYFAMLDYGLFQLAWLVRELTEARTELARVTALRERLRFGRDLNDRLGSGLFAISRLLETARDLEAERPEVAEEELAEALRLVRELSDDVRAIAHGDHEKIMSHG